MRQKLIHEIDVPRILPRLKSEEEKQAESRKKYLNATITYLTEENKKQQNIQKQKSAKTNTKRNLDKAVSKVQMQRQ